MTSTIEALQLYQEQVELLEKEIQSRKQRKQNKRGGGGSDTSSALAVATNAIRAACASVPASLHRICFYNSDVRRILISPSLVHPLVLDVNRSFLESNVMYPLSLSREAVLSMGLTMMDLLGTHPTVTDAMTAVVQRCLSGEMVEISIAFCLDQIAEATRRAMQTLPQCRAHNAEIALLKATGTRNLDQYDNKRRICPFPPVNIMLGFAYIWAVFDDAPSDPSDALSTFEELRAPDGRRARYFNMAQYDHNISLCTDPNILACILDPQLMPRVRSRYGHGFGVARSGIPVHFGGVG